jgi:hypothetical protein
MAIGPRSTVDLALPAGWDGAALERLRLQDGTTIAAVVQRIVTAVNGINAELRADPWIGGLSFLTTQRTVRYASGGSGSAMDVHTEYGLPPEQRGVSVGHMAPRNKRDMILGWTWDFLNDAIAEDIDADIRFNVDRVRNEFQKAPLTRLFSNAQNTVETSGLDVGMAEGSATGVIYQPPATPQAPTGFLSTHSHYNKRTTALTAVNIEATVRDVWEHGHPPPYIGLFADADRATLAGLAATGAFKYYPRASAIINYANTDVARVPEAYDAVLTTAYGDVFVTYSARVPTNYFAIIKSYGVNSPRNPLRWWFNDRFGAGVVPLAGKQVRQFPIEGLMLYAEYGFTGGPDRTAVSVTQIAASGATYDVPTIS